MSSKFFITIFIIGVICALSFQASCRKSDTDIIGCVYGKIKGSNYKIALGCMTKVEFDRYLDSPFQTYNGQVINRDLTFTKVDDCLECQ